MKKHILFIVENNSVPRDIRVWYEALSAIDFGYEVSVICPDDGDLMENERSLGDIQVYRHPQPLEGNAQSGLLAEYCNALFWEFLLSVRVYLKKPFHVIHAANPPDLLFLVALPFKLLGVKFIFDHHDLSPENYVAKFGKRGFFYYLSLLMEKLSFKTADVVISTNQSYKQIAVDRGGKKPKDIFVVRNGPKLSNINPPKPNENLRNGFRYLVGYVGSIGQQEGIENLLRAADYIVNINNRTDVKFMVIGKGPHWQAVVDLSKKMALDKYVWFTGFIPDKELFEILATVDVCVNPEFANEFTDKSTMIKIMEYMTFKKPIVQFYTTEGAVTAGDAAIYVKQNSEIAFAEALLALLEDNEKRESMGNIGWQRIREKLCWEKQQVMLKEAYNRAFCD